MFRARPAGPVATAAPDGLSPAVSRRQGTRVATSVRTPLRGVDVLVRAVYAAVSVVVLIIVAAILLAVFNANPANSIVSEVHAWGHWLAGPFVGMFSFRNANDAIAVNWGIAAVVYLVVGAGIAMLIGRTTPETISERNVSENLTQDEPIAPPV